MDLAKLRALKIVRIDPPHKSGTSTPKVLGLFRAQAAAEGADALTERIVLLQLADQYYVCGFRLLKYGDTCRIQGLISYFASDTGDVLHGVEKTTPEEFEVRTK
jgi:hypothetical protein